MKKLLLVTAILGIGVTAIHAQSWTAQVSATGEDLNSIFFTDSCTGYAFGTAGAILKTTSRGGSWKRQFTSPDYDMYASHFFNNNIGMAVGHDLGTGGGFIIKTTDGGLTWLADTINSFPDRLMDIFFINSTTGWIVGRNGYVAKTTNSGGIWTSQNSTVGNHLMGVYFSDANNGWAVGFGGIIINTNNSGTNWVIQTSNTGEDLNSVSFPNSLQGWAVGINDEIVSTNDGGITWVPSNTGTGEDLFDVIFVNDSTGWIVGTAGTIVMTIDTGNIWNTQSSNTGEDIFSIHMLSFTLGWYCGTADAIGYYGTIPPPSADFSFANTCLGNTTNFTNLSTGNPTSWLWNFGDGDTSTLQNPTHIYSASGTYNVTLEIANATLCTDTIIKVVAISAIPPVADFTAITTTACVGIPVDFTDLSANTPATWTWDFGDGNADNVPNPGNTYLTPGTFTVTLIVNNGCGADVMIKNSYINVITNTLNAGFIFDTVCAGAATNFTDTSLGTATIWEWDFNDGNPNDTTQNPFHIFTTGGIYNVILTILEGACESIANSMVIVNNSPKTDFSTTIACLGDTTFFTDLSVGIPTGWSWDFGDGSPVDTNQDPYHIYTAGGNYNVNLITFDSIGCSDTVVQVVSVVSLPPVANFSATPTTVCAGSIVSFTDLSTNSPDTWSWTFGNGNVSGAQNPVNTYITPGAYSVTLVTSNGCGADALVMNNLITVTANTLSADFTFNTACAGMATNFTDISIGSPITWEWDFDDGSPLDSTQNPSHIFVSQGTYNVTLTISSDPCVSIITQLVLVSTVPIADFLNTTVCLGDTTDFTDLSNAGGGGALLTGWVWDFGDGSPVDTNQNTFHIFPTAGNYSVSMTVTNSGECTDNSTKTVTINEAIISVTPTAPVLCTAGDSVTLSASGGATYSWSPATGLSATTGATVIAFPSINTTYTVTGTDINGCVDSATSTVTLDSMSTPVADFSVSDTAGCGSLNVIFTNNSTNATGFIWLFPGGNPDSSTTQNPSVLFTISGSYDVSLIASGCSTSDTLSFTGYIDLFADVISSFISSQNTVDLAVSGTVSFTNLSSGATVWNWDFGDGIGTDTAKNPTYTYTTTGVHVVTLVVSDGGICSDTMTDIITVTNSLGISQLSNNTLISIYPNPAKEVLNIETKGTNMLSITIINALGQAMSYITIYDNSVQISTADYVNGFYFILIETNEGLIRRKISINN